MDKEIFEGIMQGAREAVEYAKAVKEGKPIPKGMRVTTYKQPPNVDVKGIRKKLHMTQAAFAEIFGFSINTVKHWESGQRCPEGPTRLFLTVIDRNPKAVIEALQI
jgi:putative transcriptional regulator